MAIKYVDWRKPDNRVPYASDIRDEVDATWFNEEGDTFVTFLNEENGKYAVYYKLAHGGMLCSLAEHFDEYSRLVDTADGLSDELYAVIRKRAVDCGFPPVHPPISEGITWREVIARLHKADSGFLDTVAYVCMDNDGNLEPIYDVKPWYEDGKPTGENVLYLDLTRNREE